jgi:hypothetical protein
MNFATGRVRDRKASQEYLAEENKTVREREAAIRESQERTAKAILDEHKERTEAILSLERQIIEMNSLYDDKWVLPPSVSGKHLPVDEGNAFNRAEAQRFVAETPEYYPTQHNMETMLDYLAAQRVQLANVETFRRAFNRLTELGMLETRPVTVKTPVNLQPDKKEYTDEELNAMTADQYAKAIGLRRARPEEVVPVKTGKVKVDEALEDLPGETADQYRARLAKAGISTRLPVRAPW